MRLSEVKTLLQTATTLDFKLADGTPVPGHFHVTEVGIIAKNFIDCGGTVRSEKKAAFQLWNANDYDHRLKPQKLLSIIALSEKLLSIEDYEVEVEYQAAGTIGKYSLHFDGAAFVLSGTQTACLATDSSGYQKGCNWLYRRRRTPAARRAVAHKSESWKQNRLSRVKRSHTSAGINVSALSSRVLWH